MSSGSGSGSSWRLGEVLSLEDLAAAAAEWQQILQQQQQNDIDSTDIEAATEAESDDTCSTRAPGGAHEFARVVREARIVIPIPRPPADPAAPPPLHHWTQQPAAPKRLRLRNKVIAKAKAKAAAKAESDDNCDEAAPKVKAKAKAKAAAKAESDDSSNEAASQAESDDSRHEVARLFEQLNPQMYQHFRSRLSQYSLARLARTQARSSDA